MAISRSSAFLFGMHDLNGVLFLKVSFLFLLLALLVCGSAISSFATIYASL